MKARTFFLMMVFGIFLINAYSQQEQEPGTAPADYANRSITANGLTQIFSASGHFYLSADGGGSTASSYTIDVDKPIAGATVYKAYFLAASQGFNNFNIPNGCITLNGNPISWNATLASSISSYNHYADVTGLIAGIMNPAGAGITSLVVTECGPTDGTALLVVFANPSLPEETIVIMFGALSTTGDNFNITLGTPIDPIVPGALLEMGLGISFGAQGQCSGQYSRIDVNGARLTTSAGGEDDGALANGALITVGGLGDANTNPPDPFGASNCNARYDDELYSLLPYITNTTINILVNTLNPSNDDNIFLAYFEISGAAIIGEGILLSQEEDVNPVGTNHTVTALVQNNLGDPVPGMLVGFTVISGPNAGTNGSAVTNASGIATFTYNGSGGPGIDEIQACFINSQQVEQCSNILDKTWEGEVPPVPVSNWALIIGIMMILVFTVIRFRK